MKKEIGIIGLGKMGKNMALRLSDKKWHVFAFDIDENRRKDVEKNGIKTVNSLKEIIEKTSSPRLIWLMLPAGKIVEDILFSEQGLIYYLKKGDIVIDGGNSFFEDSIRRGKKLERKGIAFIDVGVSGGPEGARNGACLMIGGKKEIFEKLKPLFRDLSQNESFQYLGKQGAGHFVKMVHNGIEYGMMQAIAEGFNLMKNSIFKLDLKKIASLYNKGSVIESRLIGWLEKAYEKHGESLKIVSGKVSFTGEGEWTVKTAKKLNVPVKIIEESVKFRKKSHKNPSYIGKILSALREQFGGHNVIETSK
jgi:6-phosphogluconate dehydrogenase